MTLRDAVAIAQQHEEARMSFVLRRSEHDGGINFGTGPVRPHSMGDGGFMAKGPMWNHLPGGLLIAWDDITGWAFRLEATGKNDDTRRSS